MPGLKLDLLHEAANTLESLEHMSQLSSGNELDQSSDGVSEQGIGNKRPAYSERPNELPSESEHDEGEPAVIPAKRHKGSATATTGGVTRSSFDAMYFRVYGEDEEVYLLNFDKSVMNPRFFQETGNEPPCEVSPAEVLGEEVDPLNLKMPGFDRRVGNQLQAASVGELLHFLRLVLTVTLPDSMAHEATLMSGFPLLRQDVPQIFLQIKCEETVGWLTFDGEGLKPKALTTSMMEMSTQQFELEADCHSRKWKQSFKLQGAFKLSRAGVLCPATWNEMQLWAQRLLHIPKPEPMPEAGQALTASGAPPPSRSLSGNIRGATTSPTLRTPLAPPRLVPAAQAQLGRSGSQGKIVPAVAPLRGPKTPVMAQIAPPNRESQKNSEPSTSYLAIPLPPGPVGSCPPPVANPPGPLKVAGPLSAAEIHAIQAIINFSDGPKLALAVQGIMQHVMLAYGFVDPGPGKISVLENNRDRPGHSDKRT